MKLLEKLPEDAQPVKGTMNWVDPRGNLYGIETRKIKNRYSPYPVPHKNYGKYFQYHTSVNSHNGYVYGCFKYIVDQDAGKFIKKTRRLHIVIAETFIENPNNYPIVGHRNNIKTDNRIENLYWTTWKENSQKAVNDGLSVNDRGYEDSQSHPVVMFDTYTNKECGRFGSCTQASKYTGIGINTIVRQAKYKKPVRKPFYFRFQDDDSALPPTVVVQFDLITHAEIGRYWNSFEASRKTGISYHTISDQCNKNKIPNWTKSGTYFLFR